MERGGGGRKGEGEIEKERKIEKGEKEGERKREHYIKLN